MSVDDDARVFGQHFKQGGWRLGLLVARNVEPGKGQGKPRPPVDEVATEKPCKVSGAEFAAKAGVSKQNVAYYFHAWRLAADDGKVPHAENLSPLDDESLDHIDEDDEHTREEWSKYLQMAKEPKQPRKTGGAQRSKPSSAKSSEPTTPDTKAAKAVKAVAETADQLHKKLAHVLTHVGTTLMGDKTGVAHFAEDLRATRSALDKQCQQIDRLLDSIGYGDTETQPEGASA